MSTENFAPKFLSNVADWVLEEQFEGRRPTREDLARHFELSIDRADALAGEIDRRVEFSREVVPRRYRRWDE